MNFKIASDQMVNGFTLQEKTFAKDYAEAAYLDADSRTSGQVYLRSPVQRLNESLAEANRLVKDANLNTALRRLVVYCDTLEIPENVVVAHDDLANDLDLRIFARKLQCLGDAKNALTMSLSTTSILDIFTYSLPASFGVNFISTDGSSRSKSLSIDRDKWGIQVVCTGEDFYTEQFEPSMLDMSTADYLDRLRPDGTVEAESYINDNLPRLVYFQFLVAASILHTDRQLSLEILNWVCNLSASPTTVSLNIQASSLRNTLILSNTHNIFNVPSVNIYASKQVLKSRLIAAKAFEDAFRSFAAQDTTTGNFAALTANMLARSEDAITEYQFLEALAQKGYEAAVNANNVAQKRFLENEKSLDTAQKDLNAGIDAWGKKKEQEAVVGVCKAVVDVFGAVAATVATGGLAAPSIGTAINSGVGGIKTLSEIFKKLKQLYEEIKPVIESLTKLAGEVAGVVATLEAAKKLRDEIAVQRPDMDMDVFNATALWDIFREQVDDMEKAIASVDCDGKREYFLSLRKLVVNGKTYLQTQEYLCRRGDDLAVVLVKLQRRDQARLTLSTRTLMQQDAVLDILRRAMFDRLLSIRSLIFLDFQSYSEAYMFHALTPYSPITFSPVQPVVDFLDAAAKLQGSVVAFGSRVQIQNRRFVIRTLGNATDATDLRAQFGAGQSVTVSLRPDQNIFNGFSRIRVSRVRCYLDGVKTVYPPTEMDTLRLYLKTPGRFSDIALPGARTDRVSNFVGDARALLFEYVPLDGSIVCDGEYSQQRDCTLQTPLTEWEVCIAPGGLEVKDLDLEELTGLRMEFWCDVTLGDL
ncbi:hypothetical protein QC763_609220 [Podospora pseudopauciseta]|uniref:Tc toxin complex TcA C-terminal TcB-binding domain-containing protein n=1 Tax=Podospora pseudopauciseta TaxID=2093780 RepID=A0ABR0H6J3_9PEZI|nr:hypothetical protein QC763_609220 [Podospora pseudopauciseta]